eukprot:CAMPEP_0170148420 /NCGR_PEP_ID=MMETSP0033_2-20121228/38809_1 /TAXON_ID=195969 /ORGANISM="Dolichomastix tenuilepis, Strain CCMP3274" /LENGTH=242 /DNA_ID=CAMNT_0010385309 /DNA_START=31 /DNA_END=759 /DNA_ORIENTATION=-
MKAAHSGGAPLLGGAGTRAARPARGGRGRASQARATTTHARLFAAAAGIEFEDAVASTDDDALRREVTKRVTEHARHRRPGKAAAELMALAQDGVLPDLAAAAAAVRACVRAKDIPRAEAVFESTFGSGLVKPDEHVLVTLLEGYVEAKPPRWGEVTALLAQYQPKFGVAPSTATFNALLGACAQMNDTERGLALLERMQEEKVPIDEQTLQACKKRRVLRSVVKRVLSRMHPDDLDDADGL